VLYRRHDAPRSEEQWRAFLLEHRFGQLVAAGNGSEPPFVIPAHWTAHVRMIAPGTRYFGIYRRLRGDSESLNRNLETPCTGTTALTVGAGGASSSTCWALLGL
jgi:hypothetical protein